MPLDSTYFKSDEECKRIRVRMMMRSGSRRTADRCTVVAALLFLFCPLFAGQPFKAEKLAEIDAATRQAIADKKLPGGVLWVEHGDQVYRQAYGNRSLVPTTEEMAEDTLFDVASLTKVLATAPAIMILVERGQLKLDAAVTNYLPEFAPNGKEGITVKHLLTHTSGLRAGLGGPPELTNYTAAIKLACRETPTAPPGTLFRYSDINFIILGELVNRVSGKPLNEFALEEIYRPLKMSQTMFLPPKSERSRIAPTEVSGNRPLRGEVHDPTARRMGGVAGHAGLFSTVADTARFARMILNGGELDGVRILKKESIALMTSVQSPASVNARRGLGWDIDSGYSRRGTVFPLGSFGHTGFTGTCLWIDPFSKSFYVLFTNRVHPTRDTNIAALQRAIGTLSAEAISDFDFSKVSGALPARATRDE
jgi:CubicO group peptidase (beta-lactamase class C family)